MFTVVGAYLTMLGSLVAVILLFRRGEGMAVDACSGCGYPLEGLERAPRCPECGLAREEMKPAPSLGRSWLEGIAAALLGPSFIASVAATVTLIMRPFADVAVVAGIATAPYSVILLMVLTTHRSHRLRRSVQFSCVPALVCAPFLLLVMYSYWTGPVYNGDSGWPVTNIAFFSVLGFALFVAMWLVWMLRWGVSLAISLRA